LLQHRLIGIAAAAAALTCAVAPSAQAAEQGQVIVKLKPGLAGSAVASVLDAGRQVGVVKANGARVLAVPGSATKVAAALNRNPLVQYAEVDKVLKATATPNDPQFGALYGMQKISAPAGWDAFGLGTFPNTGGVKVGIVDTGILASHADLGAARVVNCASTGAGFLGIIGGDPNPTESRGCADDNGHGTHVAGTIAASANNATGVTGVAFNSPLAICKALHGVAGSGSTSGVANCITYLAGKGAKVISMSLGGGASSTLQAAATNATNQGALLIAAAGNDGNSTVNFPAGYPEVVSVAATDRNDARASFSNANADVEIAAPGVDITSTWNDGAYNTISGTSMATPHVAGAAALIRFENPGFTVAQTRTKLQASVDDLGAANRDPVFGFGRLNLLKAGS
jgi:thermitase